MAPVRKIARADVFDLRSSLLEKHVRYSVIFPADYSSASADLPLLYLLHGLFGSHENWLTKTNILEYAADHSFLIVCPDDGDGWYTDSPHLKGHCYESYLLQELMPAVEGRFRAGGLRSRRAVAGISMGGYGAFKLAFRQPEMFCLAASMSGAFHAAEVTADGAWPELQPSILEIFRDNDPLRKENNIFEIAEAFDPTQAARLPFLHIDCGIEDSFLSVNKRFDEVLNRRDIAHNFEIFSGGHDWSYWNLHLKNIFHIAAQFFK